MLVTLVSPSWLYTMLSIIYNSCLHSEDKETEAFEVNQLAQGFTVRKSRVTAKQTGSAVPVLNQRNQSEFEIGLCALIQVLEQDNFSQLHKPGFVYLELLPWTEPQLTNTLGDGSKVWIGCQ